MEPRRRRRFTPEEDERLRQLIVELGPDAWQLVSQSMPGRAARDCRDRWHCYLSDFNKNDPWTPEEDALLLEKLDLHGPQWVRIARDFPNRSDLAVKRRWFAIFHRQRKMLLRDALKLAPRRRPAAPEAAQSGAPAPPADCKRPGPVEWISWDDIPADAVKASMSEW
jgi:hypothetical protein